MRSGGELDEVSVVHAEPWAAATQSEPLPHGEAVTASRAACASGPAADADGSRGLHGSGRLSCATGRGRRGRRREALVVPGATRLRIGAGGELPRRLAAARVAANRVRPKPAAATLRDPSA
jgi:hypothetical protein